MKMYQCSNCGKEQPVRGVQYANKYCNNKCQKDHESKERVRQWLEEGKDWGASIPKWVHRYLSDVRGYFCEVCGISDHNGKPLKLECDHIDGNHSNNTVKNLRLICPNCHSQTDTYKAKNKGNGRSYRRKAQHNTESV
jgi:DNA-directed RNA polymerase subunit M/transcription elongation factor TFIIS